MPDFKSRLLIVDDEPATRLLLSQIFLGMGHDVVSAADGFDALRQMRDTMPDIILSDLTSRERRWRIQWDCEEDRGA
jgi:CheY-like chemotaxis protein